jgi:predicted nucleotidyltransferase
MPEKPSTAAEYSKEQVELVKATCLYVATILSDYMEDVVIVGGLVPSMLIDQNNLPEGADRHVGTIDLDMGLTLAILDDKRYQAITERLRSAKFSPDVNEEGNLTRQRWKIEKIGKVTIDFLIPPVSYNDAGGQIKSIEQDFAAVITPGLELAFKDRIIITLAGDTLFGEKAKRDVYVCGPGAFVVLKALAFRNRGENKDAYDLYYHIRNYGSGVEELADALKPLLHEKEAKEAIRILKEDFAGNDSVGAVRAARFITGGTDEAIQAEVAGFVRDLLDLCNLEEI